MCVYKGDGAASDAKIVEQRMVHNYNQKVARIPIISGQQPAARRGYVRVGEHG